MRISDWLKHFWHVVSNIRPIVWMLLYLGLIPIFALIYFWMPEWQFRIPDNAGTDYGSWLYYSIVTITTLGFGDYTPAHGWAQAVSAIEVGCGIVFLGFFLNAVGSMKSEIDIESELEKQKRLHYSMEQQKLMGYLPVILSRLNTYISDCKKFQSSKGTKDEKKEFMDYTLRMSLFIDSLQTKIDLTLWPDVLEGCFEFVSTYQLNESLGNERITTDFANQTAQTAAHLERAFTLASDSQFAN